MILYLKRPRRAGYLLTEALVYISVLFVVLGVGYFAVHRFIDHSVALRHYSDDINGAVNAGERWRADVRSSAGITLTPDQSGARLVSLRSATNSIEYRFAEQTVFRRVNGGTWTRVLANVKQSRMESEKRGAVVAWRWELLLTPGTKTKAPPRVQPLFTFLAVPGSKPEL